MNLLSPTQRAPNNINLSRNECTFHEPWAGSPRIEWIIHLIFGYFVFYKHDMHHDIKVPTTDNQQSAQNTTEQFITILYELWIQVVLYERFCLWIIYMCSMYIFDNNFDEKNTIKCFVIIWWSSVGICFDTIFDFAFEAIVFRFGNVYFSLIFQIKVVWWNWSFDHLQ